MLVKRRKIDFLKKILYNIYVIKVNKNQFYKNGECSLKGKTLGEAE